MNWSADQYLKFENERSRPVRDLLAAVPELAPRSVIDVGCGPGNSTELLAARFPHAQIAGLDNSTDMLAAARRRLPGVRFDLVDIEDWVDGADAAPVGPFDVIFANAVLQWLPDPVRVLPALVRKLRSGGALAVQMPDNLEEPVHRCMREVAAVGPWAAKLAAAAPGQARPDRPPMLHADRYFDILRGAGCRVDLWRTTYHHVLCGGPRAVVEWFKGSALRPFLAVLDEAERAAFLDAYLAAITSVLTLKSDGSVLLPLPRLFFVALL